MGGKYETRGLDFIETKKITIAVNILESRMNGFGPHRISQTFTVKGQGFNIKGLNHFLGFLVALLKT